jgi:glycosyltransferase involved in cell wall biosynthesis
VKDALRIALIASNRFPIRQPFAGGLEAHVWHLARALTERGHHVSVFAAPGSDPDVGCTPLAAVRDLTLSPAARADTSMPAVAFMTDHHAYLTLMLTLGPSTEFDLIHNHSLHHLPIAMAPMLSTPMLTTVHTPPTPWLESALTVTRATGTELAAVSEHTAAAWRTIASRITVVPNGIDIDRWPLGPGGAYLVWFGRITPEKAPHMAIAAAQRARMPLVVAGPISDPTYFADQVAPHLDKDIRYAGHLNQTELARLVGGAAAALVTPMWDEPYGLVVAEAMSCGTPVVAFARGGVPELVGDTGGQLVPPADIAGMAQAIPAAIGLPRTQVRCHAVRRCSLDSMLAAYLARYRQMIDEVSDGTDDRVLHPPPRLRPPGASRQHRHSDEQASCSADFAGHP